MIKHLSFESNVPDNFYSEQDGKLLKWQKAWICTSSSEYTNVWDTSDNADEYLKVYESYVGQKYVERTSNQYVYTSVYWVHYVDGVQTETYLSTYQLNSFECSTLTPQTSSTTISGETVEYVSCYIIDSNAKFSEHHIKVTYKSPDTGNILSAEYSIYYLEEVGFEIGEPITWYPFRNLLTGENFGYGRLNFECTADNGEKITQTYSQTRNTSNICYDFPGIQNADFEFGDGQSVGYTFVSSYTYREYTGNITWNIRPYSHAENNATYAGYTVKDLELTEFTIKSDVEYYSDIVVPSEYEDMEDYYSKILQNSTKSLTSNEFEAPYLSSNFSDHNINIYWYIYSYPASTGYVYWGDGTFSFYAAGNYYQSSTSKVDLVTATNVKLQNGYKLVDGKRTAQYISPYKDPQTHVYDQSGEYTVTITSAYASNLIQVAEAYQNCVQPEFLHDIDTPFTKSNGQYTFVSGGTVTSYTPYTDFILPGSPPSSQVTEIKICDGCFVGAYRSVSGGYYYTRRGHYGAYNTDSTDGILTYSASNNTTSHFTNVTTLRLPKMSASCTPQLRNNLVYNFFPYAKLLKSIYYDGTKSEFQDIFGTGGEYIDYSNYNLLNYVGNNDTFRNSRYGATYTLTVHCTDGDITVTVK
ncbi:MAG: hypothetical protein ACI4I6_06625 [Hominimerdicola sp.]